MTHPDVALDVQSGTSGESEGFHVGEDLGLVDAALGPRAPESGDELVIDRAAGKDSRNYRNFARWAHCFAVTRIRRLIESSSWHRYARNSR